MLRPVSRSAGQPVPVSTASPNAVKVETPRRQPNLVTTGVNSRSAASSSIAASSRARRFAYRSDLLAALMPRGTVGQPVWASPIGSLRTVRQEGSVGLGGHSAVHGRPCRGDFLCRKDDPLMSGRADLVGVPQRPRAAAAS